MSHEMKDLVTQVQRLPTLRCIAAKIVGLCSDPQTPVSKLIEVISSDQAILVQILKAANSSYFNFPGKIISLEEAIPVLGFSLMRDIAFSVALYSLYQNMEANSDFDFGELWEHAFLTGVIGKALAEKYDPQQKELLFIAGSFHDIGKLVLCQIIEKDFNFIFLKSKQENLKLHTLERKILGFHHGHIGAFLLYSWNLPKVLASMVKYHHYPDEFGGDEEESRMIRFLYLSNLLAHFIQNNFKDFEEIRTIDAKFNQYFSFTDSEFKEIVNYAKAFVNNHKTLKQVLQS